MSVVAVDNQVRPLDKKIMLVLPWYKSASPLTAYCVLQLSDKRRTASYINYGDAFVAHSRNGCADLFLESGMDYMLTIDDDMVVPFGNAAWFNAHSKFNLKEPFASYNAIDRLLSHGKTLVGGLYFGRWKGGHPMYGEGHLSMESVYAHLAPHNDCKPTRWVGTGCMLIHRNVYLDIEKTFPNLARGANGKGGQWFSSSEHVAMDWITRTRDFLGDGAMTGEKAMKAYEMLEGAARDAKANSTLGMGEDVQFCIRAKQAGHQPHVDMGLVCGHVGQHIYGP